MAIADDLQPICLHAWIPATRTLGPYLRAALWVQGCPLRCPGCMTPAAQPEEGGEQAGIQQLAAALCALPDIEGVTISGGEPFAQAEALAALLNTVQQEKDLGIIIYSGYTLEKLRALAEKSSAISALLELTDVLIDGPYVAERNDGLSLRGSSNQRVHALTPRYRDLIAKCYGTPERPVEMHVLQSDVMLAGVPGEETLTRWRDNFFVRR
ncbi:MAG: radical SAM protein [Gammaproteobacteria bacterium]|nr:radical SAM protein [Gammaproteobacteria bacterium]